MDTMDVDAKATSTADERPTYDIAPNPRPEVFGNDVEADKAYVKKLWTWHEHERIGGRKGKEGRKGLPFSHKVLWMQGTRFFHEDQMLIETAPTQLVTCWQAVTFLWSTRNLNDKYLTVQDTMRIFDANNRRFPVFWQTWHVELELFYLMYINDRVALIDNEPINLDCPALFDYFKYCQRASL